MRQILEDGKIIQIEINWCKIVKMLYLWTDNFRLYTRNNNRLDIVMYIFIKIR